MTDPTDNRFYREKPATESFDFETLTPGSKNVAIGSTTTMSQGTDEWKQARIGSLGASSLHEVIAKTKSGPSASRANRMAALLLERETGVAQEIPETKAMRVGKEREPLARARYAFMYGVEVHECGLFRHPDFEGSHASPDGLVGCEGLVEIKCPQPAEHLDTLLLQRIPDKYVVQALWQMRCTGRMWCDYVSFNPDFAPTRQMWVKRIYRDEERLDAIEQEVISFLCELKAKESKLNAMYGELEAAE